MVPSAPEYRELKKLNLAVDNALDTRRAWMNDHMAEYARYPVGTTLFDMTTGAELGMVTQLYRYNEEQDPIYDTAMDIEYEFLTHRGYYDNTSRHAGALRYGNKDELAAQFESRAQIARLCGPNGAAEWREIFSKTKDDQTP